MNVLAYVHDEATHRIQEGREGAPSVQVEEEHLWTETVLQMLGMGFTQLRTNPSIYVSRREGTLYIGMYVDDMVLAGNGAAKMRNVKEELSSMFDIKDLGELSYNPHTP